MSVTAHSFDTTGDAYDRTQCDDRIRHGDVLVIESESVVGILVEAWPVAITAEHGEFHTVLAAWDWAKVTKNGRPDETSDMSESLRVAKALAGEKGFT
jgi:hypothetical protein